MLTMTEQAVSTLRRIETAPGTPEGAGLRIASDQGDGSLSFHMAANPHQGDEIIDRSGVRVFLENEAAILLADKTMDATTSPDGLVQFSFTDEPA